jgi:AraC-like DNA-binding protein
VYYWPSSFVHQTDLSMVEVALASGFGSVRRFNETFQLLYHRPPSELRRHATAASPAPEIKKFIKSGELKGAASQSP